MSESQTDQDNIIDQTENDNLSEDENVIPLKETKEIPEKKARPMPKKFQQNQQKYQEALEKQQRLKGGKSTASKKIPETKGTAIVKSNPIPEGMRRINVNGKFKLVPIVGHEKPTDSSAKENVTEPETIVEPEQQPIPLVEEVEPQEQQNQKKINSSSSQPTQKTKSDRNPGSKRVPSKYAKQIDMTIKNETAKKVKNFSQLRRVRDMQQVDIENVDIDVNRASVNELRKLRTIQKKKEVADAKKRMENKKETVVQNILKDESMTKLSKTLAIRNMSVNSRHKKQSDKIKNKFTSTTQKK